MDASLVLKQDQAKTLQIVSNTYRKHNPTSALQISTIFNCYGPILGGHFSGLVGYRNQNGFSQWMKA
jgi:hypothetical protein